MTPAQITASRDRLLAEGFQPNSPAIRVHEQFLATLRELDALKQAKERCDDHATREQCRESEDA
jgi:hypothetical protein